MRNARKFVAIPSERKGILCCYLSYYRVDGGNEQAIAKAVDLFGARVHTKERSLLLRNQGVDEQHADNYAWRAEV